ncbi:hypothetical protein ACGFNP_42330 [Nonomuraea sp. NPDC049269]|uniref:hypothetical protein n=1 Tax=Nonomuraea sp. NPDC049269 TaxID=3364349 RepID=UPI0037135E4C
MSSESQARDDLYDENRARDAVQGENRAHGELRGESLTRGERRTRDVVRGYHEARFRGDVPTAAALIGDEFSFRSPLMTSDDAAGHLAGIVGFVNVVTGVDLISELYGESEATLVYDVHTATPVGTQRTAEHFKLVDGRIASILLIFDATPWQPMRQLMG